MNDLIEDWALRAVQALQDVVDDAIESSADESARQDLQDLIAEFNEYL